MHGTDPSVADPDSDGDGVADPGDVCPGGDDRLDGDADTVPDSCDVCAGSDDREDFDSDGTPNGCDFRLALTGTVSPGMPITLTAHGALPGEDVRFKESPGRDGVGPCPASLGGHCYSLGAPVVHAGSSTADAAGTATLNYVVPAGAQVGRWITFQAVVIRGAGGVDSDLTQTITRVVQ